MKCMRRKYPADDDLMTMDELNTLILRDHNSSEHGIEEIKMPRDVPERPRKALRIG